MIKKTKKVFIKRKFREVIEIRKNEPVILYCEICQNERKFTAIEPNQRDHCFEEKKTEKLSGRKKEK